MGKITFLTKEGIPYISNSDLYFESNQAASKVEGCLPPFSFVDLKICERKYSILWAGLMYPFPIKGSVPAFQKR